MKIPCAERLAFVVTGLSFLNTTLTNIQLYNITLVATALILGAKFSLTEISKMWLEEKCISTLSYLFSDAKINEGDLHLAYLQNLHKVYEVKGGYFSIDDTMKHHTRFCKMIHGVEVLFDHVFQTNLKATCIVFLYYSDGGLIKFPISFRIYYKEADNHKMKWKRGKEIEFKSKNQLGIEMLEEALKNGFPKSIVLADSWFGVEPFIKELRRLKLDYIVEIRSSYNAIIPLKEPRQTSKGKLAKKQNKLTSLTDLFKSVINIIKCGLPRDIETGKKEKVLYQLKVTTVRLNSIPDSHRIIQSIDEKKQTIKYFITNQLSWEPIKIISDYCNRWVIEEFFRNAKQLTNMEGATIRSKQGVTIELCLLTWCDFLLHYENFKQGTAENSKKESITIPSIVRRTQYQNMLVFIDKIKNDEDFLKKWVKVMQKDIGRKRKQHKELVKIGEEVELQKAA